MQVKFSLKLDGILFHMSKNIITIKITNISTMKLYSKGAKSLINQIISLYLKKIFKMATYGTIECLYGNLIKRVTPSLWTARDRRNRRVKKIAHSAAHQSIICLSRTVFKPNCLISCRTAITIISTLFDWFSVQA